MEQVVNCPRCGDLYMKNAFRDVCSKCSKEEEIMYETVYKFLKQRENRAATIERVVEVTGVDETLIHKWMKKGRLHATHFPNMGYPCDNCGAIINKGKLCTPCVDQIERDLKRIQQEEEFERKKKLNDQATYHAYNKDK
ncbi:flagellar operon protein (TIGR03826 family) [Bacillus ectoiniformans]|uniref:TIGR03826 family flagellar region protein n=1 Tax=Bacillus ectoiniformans TaxID=1494429 RepID=UPI0019564C2C|nr:TIGR03826 family flagellar region protein [Bacillus ectoiniformans]MBM7649356.1 flagellar operon protein (TIGR03826 family) [Bacillus ectoiniformans]